jgi:hypothetical protein
VLVPADVCNVCRGPSILVTVEENYLPLLTRIFTFPLVPLLTPLYTIGYPEAPRRLLLLGERQPGYPPSEPSVEPYGVTNRYPLDILRHSYSTSDPTSGTLLDSPIERRDWLTRTKLFLRSTLGTGPPAIPYS